MPLLPWINWFPHASEISGCSFSSLILPFHLRGPDLCCLCPKAVELFSSLKSKRLHSYHPSNLFLKQFIIKVFMYILYWFPNL